MKRSNDPTGLQILFVGLLAIAMGLHAVGMFIYRIYTERTEAKQIDQDDQA